jgi:hypothetical protein
MQASFAAGHQWERRAHSTPTIHARHFTPVSSLACLGASRLGTNLLRAGLMAQTVLAACSPHLSTSTPPQPTPHTPSTAHEREDVHQPQAGARGQLHARPRGRLRRRQGAAILRRAIGGPRGWGPSRPAAAAHSPGVNDRLLGRPRRTQGAACGAAGGDEGMRVGNGCCPWLTAALEAALGPGWCAAVGPWRRELGGGGWLTTPCFPSMRVRWQGRNRNGEPNLLLHTAACGCLPD